MRLSFIGLITLAIAGLGTAVSASVQNLEYTLGYGPQVQVPLRLGAKTETKVITSTSLETKTEIKVIDTISKTEADGREVISKTSWDNSNSWFKRKSAVRVFAGGKS